MDTRIIKTFLVVFSAAITTLLIPILGQWYEQKTGIMPVGFYAVSGMGGIGLCIMTIFKIWNV